MAKHFRHFGIYQVWIRLTKQFKICCLGNAELIEMFARVKVTHEDRIPRES